MQQVKIDGYLFNLKTVDVIGDNIEFVIPNTESYLDIKSAFLNNKGDVEVLYDGKVMQTFKDCSNLISIFDDLLTYTIVVGKEYNDAEALRILVKSNPSVQEAKQLREKIEVMATSIPDEEAEKDMWAFPEWSFPVDYKVGDRVHYVEHLYKCVQAHTSQETWTPDVVPALFARIGDPTVEWPEWIQPTGAQDAYNIDDKVSHGEKHWISTVNANVWEPGVYGWTEVPETTTEE